MVMSVKNLAFSYEQAPIFRDLSFSATAGSIIGLLGKNGAGKSTLMQILTGLLPADKGEILNFGIDPWHMTNEVKQKVGYVAQKFDHFGAINARHLFEYLAAFYASWDLKYQQHLINTFEIDVSKQIAALSEGQQQKVAIIAALAHKPEILVLDEPVASLDPISRRNFIRELVELNATCNTTVLFSSHIVSDIERIANEVMILDKGELKLHGAIDEIKETYVQLSLQFKDAVPMKLEHPNVMRYLPQKNYATAFVKECSPELINKLEEQYQAQVTTQHLDLEAIFSEVCA